MASGQSFGSRKKVMAMPDKKMCVSPDIRKLLAHRHKGRRAFIHDDLAVPTISGTARVPERQLRVISMDDEGNLIGGEHGAD